MSYEEIVNRIAPCGLSCEKCCAFSGGSVQRHARGLLDALGENFAVYAERFSDMNPVFQQYHGAEPILRFFAEGPCRGCREQGCLFAACGVPSCAKNRKVDFCFQCSDFPCSDLGLPEPLARVWRGSNERMRDVGIEEYYNNIKDKPRYP